MIRFGFTVVHTGRLYVDAEEADLAESAEIGELMDYVEQETGISITDARYDAKKGAIVYHYAEREDNENEERYITEY